jgi:hypothetical protein
LKGGHGIINTEIATRRIALDKIKLFKHSGKNIMAVHGRWWWEYIIAL